MRGATVRNGRLSVTAATQPVPKPLPVKREPDTVIKLFLGSKTEEEEITDLREMLEFTKTFGKLEGTLVLRLREDIEGNVFNQPYQYMIIRNIIPEDTLPSNLKNDGDPMSDFFCTLHKVELRHELTEAGEEMILTLDTADSGGKSQQVISRSPRLVQNRDSDSKRRAIIMAFKVLDDDKTFMFDETWKIWTGASELLAKLLKMYSVAGVTCFKGVNVIPDIFKYIVVIQFELGEGQDDMFAMDCIQKFRIRRMTGYTAVYSVVNQDSIQKYLDDVEEELDDSVHDGLAIHNPIFINDD